MILTGKLKNWAIKNTSVDADASDAEFKKAVGGAIASGDLSVDKFKELSMTEEDEEAESFSSTMKEFAGALKELKSMIKSEKAPDKGKVTPGMEDDPKDMPETDEINEDKKDEEKPTKSAPSKTKKASVMAKMLSGLSLALDQEDGPEGSKDISIRVKEAADNYSTTKTALLYPKQTSKGFGHVLAGKQVRDFSDPKSEGRLMDTPSDLDKAVAGSWAKFMINHAKIKSREIAFRQLPQHDKELVLFAMENMKWGGASDGGDFADIKDRKLTPHEQKALIDDSTSGGLEAAPIVFDDQVIQTPLLNGELFPLTTQVALDRGRRVEGVATAVVTGSWGGVDDTAISLFDTTSYITAFDTTIFRWQGAFRVGLDFLSDTPIDFGQYVTTQYGERLLKDLDDVVATGNGSTQPEGVMVHAGTTSINFAGSTTLGNYEALRFGVTKQEHRANIKASAVFCGTETSYQRALAIPVGASDARRLSQTQTMPDYDGYQWMQRPYKINSSLTNSQIFYAILARYRMYRRRGMTIRTSTEGDTLIRANEMLMVGTARYGGQIERGLVAAVTTTAPA